MRKPKAPEANRASIVAAAIDEFAARGFKGASMDGIAARTHTTRALINYYFGSKEKLYIAVLEQVYGELREAEARAHFETLAADDFADFPHDPAWAGGMAQLARVCAAHAAVRPAERYQEAHDPGARLREVARLLQRAQALESEVTRRHELEVALRQALEREQLAHQSKDHFLAMLGHELRNPLGVIALSLKLMELRLGDEVVQERAAPGLRLGSRG